MFCCLRTCMNGSVRKPTAANRMREPEIHLDAAHVGSDVILLSNQLRITGSGGALATAPLVQSKSYFELKIQQAGSWSVGLATRQTDLNKKFGGCDKESWCLCSDNATRHNDEEYRPVVATAITKEPLNGKLEHANDNETTAAAAAASGLIGIEDVVDDLLLTTGSNDIIPQVSEEILPTKRLFPDEGDIVGVAFDHIELNFYYNGKNLEVPFRNVKGTVYPVVYVGNGAILDIVLDNFTYGPPPGFDRIMIEQSLL